MQLAIDLSFTSAEQPARGSQQEAILRYLQGGKTLTVGEAMQELGVYALSQRCGELRRMGWNIESEPWTTPSGKRVARYRMGTDAANS